MLNHNRYASAGAPAMVATGLAASGEEVVIAKNNQPFIKLVSAKPAKNLVALVAPKG